ncbi:MAG: nitrous oxide reductase accessory protein NosL [Ignavibacteria bacterium]|nr:nitrous oxide reductase accessory protein NosL [Ignavibacteria bacterium]
MNCVKLISIIFLLLIFSRCSKSPEPINYGRDQCVFCEMLITDKKFGAELITSKGKVFKFDAIECLAAAILENEVELINSKLYVINFFRENEFIEINQAHFLRGEKVHSPMGMNLLAVKTQEELALAKNEFGGEDMDWENLLKFIKNNR